MTARRVASGCFGKPVYRIKAWRRPNEDAPSLRIVLRRYLPPPTAEERAAQRASWARQMKD